MRARLLELLEEAQRRGFLGPRPVEEQLAHSEALAALAGPPDGPFLDLGSGAGLPGLAIALAFPDSTGVLLDSGQRRTKLLDDAVRELDLAPRISVRTGRAEQLAREPDLRARFSLVVARSFGPPAVTAECARGFLQTGARLLVSEPPSSPTDRWPSTGLRELSLEGPRIHQGAGATAAELTATGPPPDRYPRRPGIPAKRPLW